MYYKSSDIKTINHSKGIHTIIFNDGSKAEYFDSTINSDQSFAIAYYRKKYGHVDYKSIVSFFKDGTIKDVYSYYV